MGRQEPGRSWPAIEVGDPKPPVAAARHLAVEAFHREVAAGGAAQVRGQAVGVTGKLDTKPATDYGTIVAMNVRYAGAPVMARVECDPDPDQEAGVRDLPPGIKVRVTGVIAMAEKDSLRLGRCRVELLEPNPMPTVTAIDLATAYKTDNKAANAKYGSKNAGRWLFVVGEVDKVTTSKMGFRTAYLKVPAGTPSLYVGIGPSDDVKAGQTVRVKAECQGAIPFGAVCGLWQATIVPEAKTPAPVAK